LLRCTREIQRFRERNIISNLLHFHLAPPGPDASSLGRPLDTAIQPRLKAQLYS
jgi:hypothetical protein